MRETSCVDEAGCRRHPLTCPRAGLGGHSAGRRIPDDQDTIANHRLAVSFLRLHNIARNSQTERRSRVLFTRSRCDVSGWARVDPLPITWPTAAKVRPRRIRRTQVTQQQQEGWTPPLWSCAVAPNAVLLYDISAAWGRTHAMRPRRTTLHQYSALVGFSEWHGFGRPAVRLGV